MFTFRSVSVLYPVPWTLALGASVLAIRRPPGRERRRRASLGLCVGCAYDLRASEGVCPERGQRLALAAARSVERAR